MRIECTAAWSGALGVRIGAGAWRRRAPLVRAHGDEAALQQRPQLHEHLRHHGLARHVAEDARHAVELRHTQARRCPPPPPPLPLPPTGIIASSGRTAHPTGVIAVKPPTCVRAGKARTHAETRAPNPDWEEITWVRGEGR